MYYAGDVLWSPRLRTILGLRYDYYDFDVDGDDPRNSGSDNDSLWSPKFSGIYTAGDNVEFYLNAGKGFHSNDARGATIRFDPKSGEFTRFVHVDSQPDSLPGDTVLAVLEDSRGALWIGTDNGLARNTEVIGYTIRYERVGEQVAPVPVPAGLPLILAGLGAFAGLRAMRKSS